MASSSLLCQFLLISVASIGTLLMILPNANALECYHYATKNASSTMGGRAAWKLNPKFRTAIGGIEENSSAPLSMSIDDGHPTRQCPDYSTFCATLHCSNLFADNTLKYCAKMTMGYSAEKICQGYRDQLCVGDAKFYCRYCDTDKCNDD